MEAGWTTRRVTMIVLLAILALIAIVPFFYLQNLSEERNQDPAYAALAAYANSHNGDRSYDDEAAAALDTITRTERADGTEQLYAKSPDGTCWTLNVPDGPITTPPRTTTSTDCN